MTRLAFVSAPGASAFMAEILRAVADAVDGVDADLEIVEHHGYVEDVVDGRSVAVVVPHEYFSVAPWSDPAVRARTIAFGVEHQGTTTFAVSTGYARQLGSWFEIGRSTVDHLARRGHGAHHFPLGYVARWDRWRGEVRERPIDVTYLGTADERRSGILAAAAPSLATRTTELLMPPHEPMTRPRPDFLMGEAKWEHLSRCRVLVNLHREEKTAFEWVRAIEAMANGCVVVTEPSADTDPLVAGEHVLVAGAADVGPVVDSALDDPDLLDRVADAAYDLLRTRLRMERHAPALVAEAHRLAERPAPGAQTRRLTPPAPAEDPDSAPMAVWVPEVPAPQVATRSVFTRAADMVAVRGRRPEVDGPGPLAVLCVQQEDDGPWRATADGSVGAAVGADRVSRTLVSRPGPDQTGRPHRGALRNQLLTSDDSLYVAVLDGGDAPIGDGLARLCQALDDDPELDAALCPATYGSDRLVNALVPERRRLERRAYLSRGYVVRRDVLDALGGFTEDPDLDELVDHHFWLGFARVDGRARMLRHVGLALWPRSTE